MPGPYDPETPIYVDEEDMLYDDDDEDDGVAAAEALNLRRMSYGVQDEIDDPPEPCGHHCPSDCPYCGEG